MRRQSQSVVSYSRVIGFVYIFNLIVGTGVLTMPKAFEMAGCVLSGIVVYILAFMGYITATFIVEVMSIANGLTKLRNPNENGVDRIVSLYESSSSQSLPSEMYSPLPAVVNDLTPLLDFRYLSDSGEESFPFEITQRFELVEMASMFFSPIGVVLVYICFCTYLYGDLAVYAAAVPKTLRDLICDASFNSTYLNQTLLDSENQCFYWEPSFTQRHAYLACLAGFALLLGPFVFFDVARTKYLQVITTILRWFSLLFMLVLTLIGLTKSSSSANPPKPELLDLKQLPSLFGITVYAFMWHHSLPGLITPIRRKRGIQLLILADTAIIFSFYLLVSITAVFTFPHLKDLYSLNFIVDPAEPSRVPQITGLDTFLVAYPVFTISTTFPIVAITLRNNLKVLINHIICLCRGQSLNLVTSIDDNRSYNGWIMRIVYGLLAIVPPFLVAFWISNITVLVNFTGSYSGAAIQYVIPALLVLYARRHLRSHFYENTLLTLRMHRSSFQHVGFIIAILVWTIIAVVLVSVHTIWGL